MSRKRILRVVPPNGEAPVPDPLETRAAALRGLRTAWLEGGNRTGPLMLFLHGYPDTPRTWSFQLERFQDRFHVVAPFARGVTPSEPSSDLHRYGEKAWALDLLQILAEVDPGGTRPVYLVGHDLGVVAAWNLAPLLGPRLKAMVVMGGMSLEQMYARRGLWQQQRRSWYIYAFQIPLIPELFVRNFSQTFAGLAHGRLPPELRPELPPLDAMIPCYRAFAREFPLVGSRERIKLAAPVLTLWGEKDPFVVPPRWEEIAPYTERPTCRVLPGGHWIHRERAGEVNALIDAFFATEALK